MTDVLAPVARQLFLNPSTGAPAVGFKIFQYQAGTTTKLATFTDSTGGTPNSNPIVLDSLGEADIWIPASTAYKFVFSPPTDTDPPTNAIWTRDQIQTLSTIVAATMVIGGGALDGGKILTVRGASFFHGQVATDSGGFLDVSTAGYVQNSFNIVTTINANGYFQASAAPTSITMQARTVGVVLNDGANAWVAASERAKKKNLEPITGALDIVDQLEAATGHYLTDADGAKRRPFLFYEDFETLWPYPLEHVPERTHIDEENGAVTVFPEFKGMSKEGVVPLLVAAIQELRAEVRALREAAGLA